MRFEQYERHTAWDRPGGVANRSGAGDLDVVVYSARKWARLALDGNPTVLLVLFVPDEEVVFRNEAGAELAANAHRFVSRRAAARYLGYLQGQKAAMTGQPGAHTNRPELVAVHGYDTKYAMHALRLGLQGIELLTTGRITLPVPEPDREYLRSIRRGERPLAEVLDAITETEAPAGAATGQRRRPRRAGPALGGRLAAPQLPGLLGLPALSSPAAGWRRSSPRSGRPSRGRPPGAARRGGSRSPGPA